MKIFLKTVFRMALGWHFLYEGLAKILNPQWSAASFLQAAGGPFQGFYHTLADPSLIGIVDFLNEWGLILIGLGLFLGITVRWAALAGALLMVLYYFAYPPFGPTALMNPGGHVFIVNLNFLEAIILAYFAVIPETGYGVERLRAWLKSERIPSGGIDREAQRSSQRREVLKNLASLPFLGLLGWGGIIQAKTHDADATSGATIQLKSTALNELKGTLPKGRLGEHKISRIILGGNLIGGWAHARDLIYVSSLFKAYNTERKVFETLQLAEKAGINAINIGFPTNALLAKYKKIFGSRIKVISQVSPNMDKGDYFEEIHQAIDYGADIIQVIGNWCDWLVRDEKYDVIAKMLEEIRRQGYFAGLGAHTVDSLIILKEQGIIPDYYMKTMHHDRYWSAHPRKNRVPYEVDGKNYLDHNKFHNNIFCLFPDKSVDFVEQTEVPVMGYKVLAAGALEPNDGFRWAFENGADFICVGMFDFQIVENVNTTLEILADLPNRTRAWYG